MCTYAQPYTFLMESLRACFFKSLLGFIVADVTYPTLLQTSSSFRPPVGGG